MSVKLVTRKVGDVTVVDVSGKITLGEGSSALRDVLRDLTAKGEKKVLLNLSEVSYIDSSGIGELVSGFTSVANAGGTLKLLGLTKRVKDLLQITKLYTVFDVQEDEAGAIAFVNFLLGKSGQKILGANGVVTAGPKVTGLQFAPIGVEWRTKIWRVLTAGRPRRR